MCNSLTFPLHINLMKNMFDINNICVVLVIKIHMAYGISVPIRQL